MSLPLGSLRRTEDALRKETQGSWGEFVQDLDGVSPEDMEPVVTIEYEDEPGIHYVHDGNHRVRVWQDEQNLPPDTPVPALSWYSEPPDSP